MTIKISKPITGYSVRTAEDGTLLLGRIALVKSREDESFTMEAPEKPLTEEQGTYILDTLRKKITRQLDALPPAPEAPSADPAQAWLDTLTAQRRATLTARLAQLDSTDGQQQAIVAYLMDTPE